MDMRISGTTRLMALIGNPVKHSGSPQMYNYCFQYYGIDCVYLAFESDISQTKDTLDAMRRLQMPGGNVTMPCKQEVARLVDRLSPAAELIGAVNTIVNEDGILTGHNTDGKGLVLDLEDHGISVADKKIVLLGAGGAASAILVQCALDGARSVTVFNRGAQALDKVRSIGAKAKGTGITCEMSFYQMEDSAFFHEQIREADILINATSVGMAPKLEGQSLVKDMRAYHKDLVVYDVIYNPLVTKLMSDAIAHGCRPENVIGGKGMLLWQGYSAFRIFTGKKMPLEEYKRFLAEQEK